MFGYTKKYFLSVLLLLGATIVSCIVGLFSLLVVCGVVFSVLIRLDTNAGMSILIAVILAWFILAICLVIGYVYFINFVKGRINKYVSRNDIKLVIFNNIVSIILVILFSVWIVRGHLIITSLPYYKNYAAHKREQDRIEADKRRIEADKKEIERCLSELKSNPEDCYKLRWLGQLYRNLGEYVKAIETFEKVTALSPSSILSHYELGLTYVGYGDLNKAREVVYVIRGKPDYDANKVADELEVLIQKKEAEIKRLIQTK